MTSIVAFLCFVLQTPTSDKAESRASTRAGTSRAGTGKNEVRMMKYNFQPGQQQKIMDRTGKAPRMLLISFSCNKIFLINWLS